MTDAPIGRRERKKAATRALILESALTLFFERGFEQVSVREIADLADVSPKTVFTYFPRKEALVFSDEEERQDALVHAVTTRSPGTSISAALSAHYLAEIAAMGTGQQRQVMALMQGTPSLVDYAERMWLRRESALADAIADQLGLTEPTDEIRFYAQFTLQVQLHARRSTDPRATVKAGFQLLEPGWERYRSELT